MPLFKEVEPNVFVQWMGEPINGIPYPFNIENMWAYESLASIGLYRPQEPNPAPEGYKIISTTPGWDDDGLVRYIHELEPLNDDPIPITSDQVNAESLRRIESGFTFQGKEFDNDPISNRRISGSGTLASIAIMNGAQEGNLYWHLPEEVWSLTQEQKDDAHLRPFEWIVKDNSTILMDAFLTIELGKTAALWEHSHVFAARTLKNMEEIPLDYEDDIYWP